jgi:hypothetical protein
MFSKIQRESTSISTVPLYLNQFWFWFLLDDEVHREVHVWHSPIIIPFLLNNLQILMYFVWFVTKCQRNTINPAPWPESASELYRPSDHRMSTKLVPIFSDRGCHAVIVTDPYGRILVSLVRSRYLFLQVAPQLYSRGWVDPVPDPLLKKNTVAPGIEPEPLDPWPGTLTTRPQNRLQLTQHYLLFFSIRFYVNFVCCKFWRLLLLDG